MNSQIRINNIILCKYYENLIIPVFNEEQFEDGNYKVYDTDVEVRNDKIIKIKNNNEEDILFYYNGLIDSTVESYKNNYRIFNKIDYTNDKIIIKTSEEDELISCNKRYELKRKDDENIKNRYRIIKNCYRKKLKDNTVCWKKYKQEKEIYTFENNNLKCQKRFYSNIFNYDKFGRVYMNQIYVFDPYVYEYDEKDNVVNIKELNE